MKTQSTTNELLDYRDASRLLGLARPTLRSLVHRRLVPHLRLSRRIVRFSRPELESWLERKRVAEAAAGGPTGDPDLGGAKPEDTP
jgi:excisionase family DNA binding protein